MRQIAEDSTDFHEMFISHIQKVINNKFALQKLEQFTIRNNIILELNIWIYLLFLSFEKLDSISNIMTCSFLIVSFAVILATIADFRKFEHKVAERSESLSSWIEETPIGF